MAQRIDGDSARFRAIVRGKIREGLKGYISQGEMIGKKGRDLVSIPLPQITLPQFRYGSRDKGGVGAGEGDVGDPLGDPLGGPGEQPGPAGQGEGEHALEVEVSLAELAEILGEELQLPRIEPRGKKNITHTADRYNGISTVGPNSLRHFRRTYKQALRRQAAAGEYNPQQPRVVPIREDTRYRTSTPIAQPQAAAVVMYAMDVSGSMGAEQKELVRITSFWIDAWLKSQYGGLERCFIVHDVKAREVSQDEFYRVREGGGTKISSAYELMNSTIDERFSPSEWNVYGFHFSDGDNWSDDNGKCLDILEGALLPKLNQFAYGQVTSYWGSGQFMGELRERCEENEAVVTAEIGDRDAILKAIKSFLVKGR